MGREDAWPARLRLELAGERAGLEGGEESVEIVQVRVAALSLFFNCVNNVSKMKLQLLWRRRDQKLSQCLQIYILLSNLRCPLVQDVPEKPEQSLNILNSARICRRKSDYAIGKACIKRQYTCVCDISGYRDAQSTRRPNLTLL